MTLQTTKRSASIIVACGALALARRGVAMNEQRDVVTVMSDDPTQSASVTRPTITRGNHHHLGRSDFARNTCCDA